MGARWTQTWKSKLRHSLLYSLSLRKEVRPSVESEQDVDVDSWKRKRGSGRDCLKLGRDHQAEKAYQFHQQSTGPMYGTGEDELGGLLQGGVLLAEHKGETRKQEGWWEENH